MNHHNTTSTPTNRDLAPREIRDLVRMLARQIVIDPAAPYGSDYFNRSTAHLMFRLLEATTKRYPKATRAFLVKFLRKVIRRELRLRTERRS